MAASALHANFMPLCFNSREDWRLWRLHPRASKVNDSEYCSDCMPEYQRQMIVEGRCQHPGTTFETDSEGNLHGVRPGCGSGAGGPGRGDGAISPPRS